MSAILEKWEVGPHGPLVDIDQGLLTVAGEIVMPLGRFPRRMTVIALQGGGTAIWSAIALREPEMARIEALGPPRFLIVPNQAHRLDSRIWKQRYPELQVLAPPGARDKVAEAVPVDATDDIIGDPAIAFATIAGAKLGEFALQVKRAGGTTLILNDVIGHVRHPHGIGAWLMARLMGFGVHGPRVPRPIRRRMIDDPQALAAQLREWAATPDLRRIIVSHGDPIESDPAAALRKVAASLG
ncbi:hypothetical protein FHS95_001287 [Sphingomonas naasensis]|uniref:DUF4336 domain-containing protein n=1 Tax=Sphingomonas naasensis TaxID=1344951 RepID=A0A4S1W380_9SPHN|nr:hypothetical protein [Sphingomonas naasensis]NIJ19618.1 hypothetical protein [Sphingomonas naasensis]TGX37304.1 hypothetical protein E5A74_20390 [Sphingomonas naasensis]